MADESFALSTVPIMSSSLTKLSRDDIPSSAAIELLAVCEAILYSVNLPGAVLANYSILRANTVQKYKTHESKLFPHNPVLAAEKINSLKYKNSLLKQEISELKSEILSLSSTLRTVRSSQQQLINQELAKQQHNLNSLFDANLQRLQSESRHKHDKDVAAVSTELQQEKKYTWLLNQQLSTLNHTVQHNSDEIQLLVKQKEQLKSAYTSAHSGNNIQLNSLNSLRSDIEDAMSNLSTEEAQQGLLWQQLAKELERLEND
jgi:chromosome segregation ATPase